MPKKQKFREVCKMIINHNLNAMNAHRQLGINTVNAGKSMEKLSSGLRINRAGDDAAGLAISEKMRAQIRGLDQASRNAQDAISLIQTAEGALNETHSILQRMRELAVQSANDTNVSVDREAIQKEVDELAKEITRIANNTEFNTQKLLNGGITSSGIGEVKFHIGANDGQSISLSINAMDAKTLGVSRDLTTATATTAGDIDTATFGTSLGSKVVDGANITFQYNTGAAATVTAGSDANVSNDLTGKTASITVNIDGTDYKINDLSTWDGTGDIGTLTTLLKGADTNGDGLGTAISNVADITHDGNKITITSKTTGTSSSVKITFGGDNADEAKTLFGFSGTEDVTGTAAVAATITVSDGTNNQTINVDGTTVKSSDTSLSITTGDFAGITINLVSNKELTDLDSTNDKITVSVTGTAASAATFTNGALTSEAVTEAGIDVSTQSAASKAITTIQTAIETVSTERAKLGAYQNRLEHTIANLGTSSENLTAAESRVRDVDMAKEMMAFSKNNILAQAAQAMLAQANQQPQGVLQLLR
jgi:flagellin